MKLKKIVPVLLALAAAPFAHGATATSPSPANFATVDTHTTTMKDFLARKSKATTTYASGGMFFAYASTGTSSKPPADYRAAFGEDYKVNGIVKLSWKGTSGTSIVTVTRLSDGDVRTFTTTGTSVDFLAPDVGRNYKWTVKNGSDTAGPWYFFTDGEAPRIIPQSLAKVGNCRDMGGWVTEDGKYRVRQGFGYRNDHNADFYQYADLKPFWTDIAKIRTDMDLRDKLGSTGWYCNWELDSNDSPGRSPYGANWWNVLYWNVVREGDYGKKMEAYASLVSTRTGDAKKASVNTWKCFADAQNLPIVVHCSQGRDRTGTVAFVLLGALGVGLNDLYADWALTDYAAPKDFPNSSSTEGASTIVKLYTELVKAYPDSTYATLQSKCEKLLKDMGVSDAQLANLKSYLLEPVEAKLTAAAGGTSVTVPTLSKSRVTKTGSVQKPTVTSSSYYTVDYGGGGYTDYGKYLVTVTLKDPTTTHWADGTIGPKVLPFIIEHVTNVFIGDAVLSFIKGDTSPHIRIGRPRYLGEVSCNYTEEQLNDLPPGEYEATFTAKTCEMASRVNTTTCKFRVYPATEKATYTYEYADLKSAFFKTDYTPAIRTDKVEVRMMDQTDGEGYAPFSCGPYPASMTIMKISSGFLRYHHGGQRVDNDPGTWAVNKIYKLTANGKSITHYDEATAKSVTKSFSSFDEVNPTPGTAYIGCAVEKTANMGAEGTPGYHQPHRLYHVKVWANGTSLSHEFVPCKTTSGYAMLYDKVTKKVYPFSHTLNKTGSVTLGGTATKVEGGDEPGPTDYGAVDTVAATYTWKGFSGPWAYTTNWTASSGATYGIPNNKTYATADFPAGVTAATTCTLAGDMAVVNPLFNSPNLTLVLDNATLTVSGSAIDATTWGAYNFGNTKTGNPVIEFKGAGAGLVTTHSSVRANFGYLGSDTASGTCTLSFTVPATGWETTAPIRTGDDSKVIIEANVKLAVNATALGVPAAGVTKKVLLASSTDGMFYSGTATVTCANGASGEVVVEGNDLVLKVTGGATPQPEPEPTPMTKFDAAHTIICYGDSLTWGTAAAETTVDNRANFFEGRLAGVTEVPQSYPYWLSGMIPSNYNVIQQARAGSQTCNITSWSGEQTVKVKTAFTLPAVGSVSLCKNLVFGSDCSYGEQGGWAKGEPDDQDVQNRWYGFVTPIFPMMEDYDEAKTRYSITGTLGGRHVRLQGLHPTNVTVTVFGEGAATTVAAGSEFVPDNELVSPYKDAIRVICTGANDGDKNYTAEIKPHLQAFAAKGGKYLIVSPSVNTGTATGTNPTTTEQDMASTFGDHYLNLRLKMVTEGKATASALGVPFTGKWDSTDGTGLKAADGTHFNEKGYKVMAEFIRQKLVALGYVTGDEPQPDPEPTYHDWIQTDDQGFFKTTFVPNLKTTRFEVKVMATDATWTTVLAANAKTANSSASSYGNLIFLGFNTEGTVDWNNTYGGVNCGQTVAGGAFNTVHTLTAYGNSITVDGVTSTGSTAAQDQPADGPLFIGAPYDTTSASMHPLKLYYVKVWDGDKLIHNYVPGVTAAGAAILYDTVEQKELQPTKGGAFYCGDDVGPTPVDPTKYGPADTKASEYTWKGFSGPWAYTTNWTPSAAATYGIPNNTTYATATFPESLANAFTCTVDAKTDVNKFSFKSPNGTLKIANAALAASGAVGGASIASLEFGDAATGDSVLEFSGANPLLKATLNGYRLNIGYTGSESVSGSCTVRYVVPAANWTAAPLQGLGGSAQDGSKVCFWKKARVEVDATALGVPAEGAMFVVPLAFGTEAVNFYGGNTFEQFAAASAVVCAEGATGTLVLNGNQLEARIVREETPTEPEPEPTPDAFDVDHTIVCYGDSITAGWGSEVKTADDRKNYFGGRLAGQTKGSGSGMGYPYMLAGLITNEYNVIEQAKGSMWSDTISAWLGGIDIEVRQEVTIPANGAAVWCPSNLVFGAENPYGREGGLHAYDLIFSDYYDFWAGVQMTDLPVVGGYPEPAGRWSSFSGRIGDVHVRVNGTQIGHTELTGKTEGFYSTDQRWRRIGSAEEVTIPAGAKFVPDSVNVYQDAIAVVFAGTNDQNANKDNATNVIANVARAVAKIPRGRYVVVSPFAPNVRTDAIDQLYKNQFGEHLVPLYDLMESQGLARAVKIGAMTQTEADAAGHWNTKAGLMDDPDTQDLHPNARGAKVIASFVKDRLIALGYIPNDEPPVDPTKYGPADKAAATYTWNGNSGPWAYTTNWTPSAAATYGIPNNTTYATALFSADVTAPFDCTVDSSMAVRTLTFLSPNGTLRIANAALTASGLSPQGAWSSISFGDSLTGDSVLEFSGANAMLKATAVCYRLNVGYTGADAASGTCTVRYVVPAGNWTAAPLQAVGGSAKDGSKVCFGTNARVDVDATALGVPEKDQTLVVPLASGTEGIGFYDGITIEQFAAASVIVCASGAKGALVINGAQLELQIVAAASDYPSWIEEQDLATKGKYDVWKQTHVVTDPEAVQGQEAFLLNCNDTAEAVAQAKKEFVIESISFESDGSVKVVVSDTLKNKYNGMVIIRGSAEVNGDYMLSEDSKAARFFKAFLEYVPANAD